MRTVIKVYGRMLICGLLLLAMLGFYAVLPQALSFSLLAHTFQETAGQDEPAAGKCFDQFMDRAGEEVILLQSGLCCGERYEIEALFAVRDETGQEYDFEIEAWDWGQEEVLSDGDTITFSEAGAYELLLAWRGRRGEELAMVTLPVNRDYRRERERKSE